VTALHTRGGEVARVSVHVLRRALHERAGGWVGDLNDKTSFHRDVRLGVNDVPYHPHHIRRCRTAADTRSPAAARCPTKRCVAEGRERVQCLPPKQVSQLWACDLNDRLLTPGTCTMARPTVAAARASGQTPGWN